MANGRAYAARMHRWRPSCSSVGIGVTAADEDRSRVLESFAVLDTRIEQRLDELAALAAELCAAPISGIALIDADRQPGKSRHGNMATLTPHGESFCVHVIDSKELVVIADASLDPRVADCACVRDEPRLRFYAGAPLTTTDGLVVGALSVADTRPRNLNNAQRRQLTVLAAQVAAQLELRWHAIQLEAELREVRADIRMLDGVMRHTDVLVYAKDLDGKFVMVNPAVQEAARAAGNMIGRTDYDLFAPDIAAEYRRNDQHIRDTGQRQVITERIVHGDGSHRTYHSTKFPVYDDGGEVIGIAGVSTDVTDLETERTAHEDAEARLTTLVEQLPVAIAVIDKAGVLVYANPATVKLCAARNIESLQGRPAIELVAATQRDTIVAVYDAVAHGEAASCSGRSLLRRDDGIEIHIEYTANRISYAGESAIQVQARDVTAAILEREHLEQIANTDSLTGMMNRRAWTTRMLSLLAGPRSPSADLAVAMIDIDQFKAFNDSSGHLAGDVLLQQIARMIETNVRESDVVARWGGEEFVVALPDIGRSQAVSMFERLRRAMPAGQTCSIGYTFWQQVGDTLDTCIGRADKAMYAAKSAGKNRIVESSSDTARRIGVAHTITDNRIRTKP